jgi:hypothetical protein
VLTEALITSWDRLRTWLGNVPDKKEAELTRMDLRFHRRLSLAANEWAKNRGGLWSRVNLFPLQEYQAGNDNLTGLQLGFIRASQRQISRQWWTIRIAAPPSPFWLFLPYRSDCLANIIKT